MLWLRKIQLYSEPLVAVTSRYYIFYYLDCKFAKLCQVSFSIEQFHESKKHKGPEGKTESFN